LARKGARLLADDARGKPVWSWDCAEWDGARHPRRRLRQRAPLRAFIRLVAAFGIGFQAKIRLCGWAMFCAA
jgi:hypothetical protein